MPTKRWLNSTLKKLLFPNCFSSAITCPIQAGSTGNFYPSEAVLHTKSTLSAQVLSLWSHWEIRALNITLHPYIARLGLVGKLERVHTPCHPPAEALVAFSFSWRCEGRGQFTFQDRGSYSSMSPPSSFTSLGNHKEAFCLNLSTKLNIGI